MPLITCPDCSNQISDSAPNCIHCGFPFTRDRTDAAVANPTQPPAPASPSVSRSSGLRWVTALSLILAVFLLLYLAFIREGAADKDRLAEGTEMATLKLAAVGTWEDVFYARSG